MALATQNTSLPQSLRPIFEKEEASNSLAFHIKKDKDPFDPLVHNPARYDIYGNQKIIMKKPGEDPHNILVSETRIPEWWSKPTDQKFSRTELLHNRRAQKIPHISYDLDKDGIVGGRDLVISKIFDKDGDGKLNTAERRNAENAIKQGIEKNFFWNVEKSGANRPYRLLQKRGKFVDAQDYLPVTGTYPKHPISEKKAEFNTIGEFKDYVRHANREDLEKKKKAWDEANPSQVPQKFMLSEWLVTNPPHKLKSEIRKEKHKLDREKAGLTSHEVDIKVEAKDPTLVFVDKPKQFSNLKLKDERREEMLKELKQYEQAKHVDSLQRLMERQECYVRIGHKDTEGKTFKIVKDNFRKEMNENNIEKFGRQTIGVHGQELPKYAQEDKEYWRRSTGFTESPNFRSFKQMKQSHKYWAKDDKYLLNDIEVKPPSPETFKDTYVAQQRKNKVAPKPNHIKHVADTENDLRKMDQEQYYQVSKTAKRWTDEMMDFRKAQQSEGRVFDIPPARERNDDFNPLYSSFSPDGVFHPPPASRNLEILTKGRFNHKRANTVDPAKSPEVSLMARVTQRKPWAMMTGGVDTMSRTVRATLQTGIRSSGFESK